MNELVQYATEMLPEIIAFGLNLLGGILILILGWITANWLSGRVRVRAAASRNFDDTLVPVFTQTVRVFIIIVTVLAVLAQFGVQTASLLAILGAAGLAIGLALQGTLSNIAAGMMLLILRPVKIGDIVDLEGTMGIVDEIGLFTTKLHSFDNIGIVIPNSNVWGSQIKNYSQFETRRFDLEFGIGYDDDVKKAMKLIHQVVDGENRVLLDPPPLLAVSGLGDSSVNLLVRVWSKSEDVWLLKFEITQKVKEIFDANGITIPFPQRDIHLIKEN